MRATIRQVARRAGVSPSTVSRVAGGDPRVSPDTAARVLKVMEELQYYPDAAAQSLVSRSTRKLGVVLPGAASPLFQHTMLPELIRGIVHRANRSGYDLLLTTGGTEDEELDALARAVRERRVDGVVLLGSGRDDGQLDLLENERFPFVRIGRHGFRPHILTVDTDNEQASYDAIGHLIAQGHEKIGYTCGPRALTSTWDRLEGYERAMKEAGLRIEREWILEADNVQTNAFRAMSLFMRQPDPPTALVVGDDTLAVGVLRALAELGIRVPEQLSLAAFNNSPLADLVSPPLTSVDIGISLIGYAASDLLLQSLSGEEPAVRHRIVPHRLIVRASSLRPFAVR